LRRPALPPVGACLAILMLAVLSCAQAADSTPPGARVEARSADLITVGLVHGDRMSIHISRLLDNAPVRDAVVAVLLRGVSHAAVAEADGSYTLVDPDLKLAGAAAVEFQIAQGGSAQETLKGTLDVAAPAGSREEKSQARQYWWWALNFGVCIGFLALLSRRKKKSAGD
jgi:hypothetical protein